MKIPFFPNTGDGTRCFQAAMRMALAVLMPERTFTDEELDRISGKSPGKWTWPTAAMIWMMEHGLDVELVEEFDYAAFAARGGDYLVERYGEEVAAAQMANSDVDAERELARRFSRLCHVDQRVPGRADLKERLDRGSVVIVNINAAALNLQPGYSGHFVVICEAGGDLVTLHDPGLPPRPALAVPGARFDAAWGYPSGRDRNLMSIGRRS
ncbi:MAG: hypothetical protein JXA24_06880 [Proteobacteria bacterium]|nr:hypothetical protein [Pseudomonadota bacterium]